jgi:ketosteroid isomerase-like protein
MRPMREVVLALAVVGLLAFHCRAQEDNSSAVSSKLLALERAWNLAEEKGDIRALAMIFDDSMVYIDEDGALLTKSQFLTHARDARGNLRSRATQTMRVGVYGDIAVVVGSYHARGMERGQPYQRDGRFIDLWIFQRGSWTCLVAQATPMVR